MKGLGRRSFGAAVAAMLVVAYASDTRAETALKATYVISIAGLPIGRVDVDSRFTEAGYAAVIKGATSGISRLVSDARAVLAGRGRILGNRVAPASYNLETRERGLETHVRMSMSSGAVTDLLAVPRLSEVSDRVPLDADHRRNVVDPVGAFLAVADRPGSMDGHNICNRTINIFDGWQRFDIGLTYKETRLVTGTGEAYDGRVVVCTARYVPVAGHRLSHEPTRYMATNDRLEVWYAPIKDMRFFVPYRILIGTRYGDLIISSTRFATEPPLGSAVAN